jgi:tetratricopeptide (TPR) repeat protein
LVLGVYHGDTARIRLFAYVYDGRMPDRPIKELYLRLHMLATLMHELAHHYDYMARIARGRWRADSSTKKEIYAEKIEHGWVQRYVVPYLEAAYPEEVRALDRWITRHGGTSIPLSLLAGDPRKTKERKGARLFFGVPGAFERLVEEVIRSEVTTRFEFARQLHYAEQYAEALAILQRILAEDPGHSEALTLQADIAVHQKEYALAEELCERVLSANPREVDAWLVLADLHWFRRDWGKLHQVATRAVALFDAGTYDWLKSLGHRARARLELGDVDGLEADLETLAPPWCPRRSAAEAQGLRAVMLLRLGRLEEALQTAFAGLHQFPPERFWRYTRELVAVRFEAAHRLGRPSETGELTPRDLERLRWRGYEAWVDRLCAEYGLDREVAPNPGAR